MWSNILLYKAASTLCLKWQAIRFLMRTSKVVHMWSRFFELSCLNLNLKLQTQSGLSHGSGTLFSENGEILQKGQWKEDIFVESWESIHQTHLIHNVLEDHFNRNFYVFVVLFRLDIRENKIKSKQQTNFTRNKIAKETWDLIKDSKWRTIKYKIWEELLTSNKLENIEIKNR